MKNFISSIIVFIFLIGYLFFLFSCAPLSVYVTKHGFNVYCNEGVCFPKQEVEFTIDATIQKIVDKKLEGYSSEKIRKFLKSQDRWHDIFIRKVKKGSVGSCRTSKDPNRRCRGFKCSASKTGWCGGLHERVEIGGYSYSKISVVKFNECIASSALAHEMIHFFQFLIKKTSDPKHELTPFWPNVCTEIKYPEEEERIKCKRESVVRETNWEVCQKFCGDLCK